MELRSRGSFVKYVMRIPMRFALSGIAALLATSACAGRVGRPMAPAEPEAAQPAERRVLPILPAEAIVEERQAPPRVDSATQRVSVRAIDADARALLVGIANQAGLDLVVSSDVNRRVSLTLTDVPALQAIQEIVVAAGLTISTPDTRALPPVVYYQLPVNVNEASAETIAVRFGVSLEVARYIVESRKP